MAGKGARLILDWPYEQTLYLLVWTTVWGLTDREGEKTLLRTHMTWGPRGMETGTYATSTRQTTKSLSWVRNLRSRGDSQGAMTGKGECAA